MSEKFKLMLARMNFTEYGRRWRMQKRLFVHKYLQMSDESALKVLSGDKSDPSYSKNRLESSECDLTPSLKEFTELQRLENDDDANVMAT